MGLRLTNESAHERRFICALPTGRISVRSAVTLGIQPPFGLVVALKALSRPVLVTESAGYVWLPEKNGFTKFQLKNGSLPAL